MRAKTKPVVVSGTPVKATNQALYTMRDAIENFLKSDVLVPFAFSYALNKNLDRIKREITRIDASLQPSEKFQEFQKRLNELLERHAKKDPQTKKPMIRNDQYDLENYELYAEEYRKLEDEFRETLDIQEGKKKQYDEEMKKDTSVEFYLIPFKHWPKEPKSRLGYLAPLVADPSELEKQLA